MSADSPQRTPLQRWLRHLRGAFLVFHCVALFAMAFPAPGGALKRSAWKDPTVQGEFEAWTGRLNALGVPISQEELEEHLWTLTKSWLSARSTALTPFKPYYKYTCTPQSWRMFVAPHRYPTRIEVAVREGRGPWQVVYSARSSEHEWRRAFFDHDRMRAAVFRYGWRSYRTTYAGFTDWLADRAAEDFPDADYMRVRFYKYRTASPEEVRTSTEPEGRWIFTRQERLR